MFIVLLLVWIVLDQLGLPGFACCRGLPAAVVAGRYRSGV
jgi:hypothetical protein